MEVNKKTFCYIPITFLDENKSPVIPTNVTTRIDYISNSGVSIPIRPVTPLIVAATVVSVLITSAENDLFEPNPSPDSIGEIHILTVECDIPHGHVTGDHEIFVRSLRKVTT